MAPRIVSHPHNSIPYPMHPSVNKLEKENLPETYKVVLVSQVKSYKYKNLSIGSVTPEDIPWKSAF